MGTGQYETDGKPLVKEQCATSPVEFIPLIITQVTLLRLDR